MITQDVDFPELLNDGRSRFGCSVALPAELVRPTIVAFSGGCKRKRSDRVSRRLQPSVMRLCRLPAIE